MVWVSKQYLKDNYPVRMDRERSVIVDNYQITPRLVQTAFKSAKKENKSHLMLSETFKMMNLNKLYQSNPADQTVKQTIKAIVDSDFLPQNYEEDKSLNSSLDLNQLYPLNKTGNFGRVLNRKCKIADKGVMEFSDDQTPKLKEIKTFVNRVETIGMGGNDNKIQWYEQSTKYPYRIILIDNNDGHKGIYFSSQEKAEKVRIALSQQYLYRGNFNKLMGNINRVFLNSNIEQLKNKLVTRHKMISKSSRFSRNVIPPEAPPAQSRISKVDPTMSVFNRDPASLQNSKFSQPSALRVSGILQTKKPSPTMFENINRMYIENFIGTWWQRSKSQGSSVSKNTLTPLQQQKYSRVSPNPNQSIYKSRLEPANDRSSNKQESIFNRLVQNSGSHLKKSEKEGYNQVKQFERDQSDQLDFYSIQFLTLTNLFFKPIVTIELLRNAKVEHHVLYNTVIKKKDPALTYDLIKNQEEQDAPLVLTSTLKQYEIVVKVIDFLANEEVINDRLTMKNKRIIGKTTLLCDNKMIRLEFGFKKSKDGDHFEGEAQTVPLVSELKVPPLPEGVKEKISQCWEKESQSQGYYSETNLSIFRILSQLEALPLTWWKGFSEDQYELLQAVYSASKILGFKMIRSFPHIIKVFVGLYPNVEQLAQKLLSFILTFLKTYYFPEHLNRLQKFHKILGLDSDCELISKVNLQILTLSKMVQIECGTLVDRLTRSNVVYGYQMIEYIYQAFSRNLTPNNLVEIWNLFYEDLELLQLNMILLSVALLKHYEEDLMSVKRLSDFCRVLESKKVNKVQHLITSMNELKEKYFGEVKGLLDQIKNIFNSKPLQTVLEEFYKKQSAKMDAHKQQRLLEKKSALRKVNRQIDIEFPQYPSQHYTLHIYFSAVPENAGSLIIRSKDIDYQCLNLEKNRYFIIDEVSSALTLVFRDLKSNENTCELMLNQGIQEHTAYLRSQRNSVVHKISYVGGLLTDSQIEMFKRGKKIDHFISPFIKYSEFREEMSRPLGETYFLRKYDSGGSKDDLVKRIKGLFCQGNKNFNEIEFYIEQIETSDLTIEQKFNMVKLLAKQFSQQFCLCNNQIIEKHFIRHFLQSTGFQLTPSQYQCFYNDCLQYEFDAPKILKCRYYPHNQSSREIKLQAQALKYFIGKCQNYLYCDIIIDDLIQTVKPSISEQLGGFAEGELKLYYSSSGEVYLKSWQLKFKNSNKKEIYYQQIKEATAEDLEIREMGEPQVLMTQVMPSFAKITTILDYVNTNRHVDLKLKYQDKDKRKVPDNINILKNCQSKFNKAIIMRHLCYPNQLRIPFFNYYYELTHEFSIPVVKNIVLNNLKSDLKAVCLFQGQLKYGENAKIDSFFYRDDIGLYGNLRQMSKDAKGWFFFGSAKDDFDQKKELARVFVNYGYGIFRWETCQVLGFYRRAKINKNSPSKTSSSKPKKEYLIIRRNQEKTVKQYELQISIQALARVSELFDTPSKLSRLDKSFGNEEKDESMSSNLKYLSKFVK